MKHSKPDYSHIPRAPWLRACMRGKMEVLTQLANGSPWPDMHDPRSNTTSLILAASHGYEDVCKKLLANNPSLEATNKEGRTALFCAVLGDHLEVARLLLEVGANPGVKDNEGNTLILRAAINGSIDMANLIFRYGEHDLNTLANNGRSCMAAAMYCGEGMVNWLAERGADPDIEDGQSKLTPLWMASYGGECASAKALLAAGADPNRLDPQGRGYLHVAIDEGNSKVIEILLDAGADPYKPDANNITAMDMAESWPLITQLVTEYEQRKLSADTPRVEHKKSAPRL